jgi:hypothetical protein
VGQCEIHGEPKMEVIVVVGVSKVRGRSSMVERQLPKLTVAGSIPVARSILFNSKDQFPAVEKIY